MAAQKAEVDTVLAGTGGHAGPPHGQRFYVTNFIDHVPRGNTTAATILLATDRGDVQPEGFWPPTSWETGYGD